VIARFYLFRALVHQRRVLHQSSLPYLSEDRDSSSDQVVSVIRLPMRYTPVPLDSFCLHPIVHRKSHKIFFTLSDLQPSLSLLHNLVLESIVLSSCPRLSLIAGLTFFSLVLFLPSAAIYKKINLQNNFPSTDPPIHIRFSFHRHKNLIRRVLLKTGITFCSELQLR
jgi:hypothetical protein